MGGEMRILVHRLTANLFLHCDKPKLRVRVGLLMPSLTFQPIWGNFASSPNKVRN